MTGVYLSHFWTICILSFSLVEFFFFKYITHYQFRSIKIFKNTVYTIDNSIRGGVLLNFIFLWHSISYIFFKLPIDLYIYKFFFLNLTFIIFSIYYLIINQIKTLHVIRYWWVMLVVFLLSYFYIICIDFICLLLILETITILYFFFFLQYLQSSTYHLIKYKNLISQYLWLSFFTLIFFMLNLIVWVFLFGTLNIVELGYVLTRLPEVILILIAFFWKLGVPLFHFFKLEIYQFLTFSSLVAFSTLSFIINSLLFVYTLYILKIVIILNTPLLALILVTNILLLLQGLDKIQFFYFFALSSINSWAFFLLIAFL